MTIEEIKVLNIDGINERMAAIEIEKDSEDANLDELMEEVRSLTARKEEIIKNEETRKAIAEQVANGEIGKEVRKFEEVKEMTNEEMRAKDLKENGRIEMRALLSTGKIAKPSAVSGIADTASELGTGIVDDVNAISLNGKGSWVAAYKKTNAAAANVTDGSAVGGTASTYDYVTINPSEWGVIDEISKLVAKMSPLDYMGAIEKAALRALREKADAVILAAIDASALKEDVTVALDADYLRSLVLGFSSIPGKGNVKLYIGQEDLATLGKVRGTSEKRPLYSITFDQGTTKSGTIQEGGIAVPFRIVDLEAGTQYFGQPGAIDMPMWDNYEISTNEGGDYFKRNMIGIRGLQTAGADLVALHGMQKVANA